MDVEAFVHLEESICLQACANLTFPSGYFDYANVEILSRQQNYNAEVCIRTPNITYLNFRPNHNAYFYKISILL